MYSVVLTTCPERETARELALLLLKGGLAACVQEEEIISSYMWNKGIAVEPEVKLTIKCKKANIPAIFKLIKENHPYEVPEIVEIPIISGDADYLSWIELTNNS